MAPEPRPLGLKLIVAYKAVKAPLMLALAVALTADASGALRLAEHFVHELSEGGLLLARLAHWLEWHLSPRAIRHGAWVAWLDGVTTSVEAVLLWRGHALGEWVVVGALAVLVPFELHAVAKHPSALRVAVLLLNLAIVAYLTRLRLGVRKAASDEGSAGRA